jgi:hypothetical protein
MLFERRQPGVSESGRLPEPLDSKISQSITWYLKLKTNVLAKANSKYNSQSPAGKNVSREAEDIVEIRHQATTGKDIVN